MRTQPLATISTQGNIVERTTLNFRKGVATTEIVKRTERTSPRKIPLVAMSLIV